MSRTQRTRASRLRRWWPPLSRRSPQLLLSPPIVGARCRKRIRSESALGVGENPDPVDRALRSVVPHSPIRGSADGERGPRRDDLAMTTLDSISTKHERPKFDELQVADVMHAGVLTCLMDAPLDVVAEMMASYGIHCVVVYEQPGLVVDGFW